jgi:PhnB protein
MATVKPIPDGYPRVTPSLIIDGAPAAIEFYDAVLGTSVRMRMDSPDGKVGHAELQLGDSVIMLADEFPDMGYLGPKSVGGTSVTLSVYVEDVDAVFERALAAGATEVRAIENQFYGDRSGQFEDPFGHRWNVATHIEDVPDDEMMRRATEAMSEG